MKRVEHVDLLRAIGILLMVMGHVGFGPEFNHWIHIFHMPMFFIISGYFYKPQSFGMMLKKRFATLLFPYLVFGLFHVGLYFLYMRAFDPHAFYLLFWENTAETGVPIAGALWFLTAMFFAEILFWAIQNLKLPLLWETAVAALVAVTGMALAAYLPFRLPWALDASMTGIGLYQIGKLLKTKGEKLLELNWMLSLLGVILFSILGMINGYVNLREGTFGYWPLFWIDAVGMTISLWSLCRWICERAGKEKAREKGSAREKENVREKENAQEKGSTERKGGTPNRMALIYGIGRDSIVWLCLNQVVVLAVAMVAGFIFHEPTGITFYLVHLGIFLISVVCLVIAQMIIMNTFF
ncbi:MAG: acyltransferase family protein, partial [Lachnospiraceae bacterium]|nr:acyltransferase family protein [Lachnospiraceae bacterium]